MSERRAGFTPWFWSYRLAQKLEAVVVVCVLAGVVVIMGILVQMPGPLVVHLQDDLREAVKNARVRCTSPDGKTSYAGMTDNFGEAKWPGLAKGAWKCEVTPPPNFHAETEVGYVTVVSRKPAMWIATVERPALIRVEVKRPSGTPRAAMAVRAVCEGGGTWEARAGVLDGRTVLFVPHGKSCRVGLVRPELHGAGPTTSKELDCASEPCSDEIIGGVGEQHEVHFAPTAAQWMSIRPPPEPDPEK